MRLGHDDVQRLTVTRFNLANDFTALDCMKTAILIRIDFDRLAISALGLLDQNRTSRKF